MKSVPVPQNKASRWILNPNWDLFLFVLAPLWIIPLIWLVKDRVYMNTLGVIILALGATGHHMPGMIRAYTDPQLFKRYRIRFILSPIFFLTVCMLFARFDLHALYLVLVLWGAWHGAMQTNGFLRIYDSKAGSISRMTARLDWAMCLAWFGGAILYSPVKLMAIFTFFYQSGGLLIPPEGFFLFRQAWDVFAIAVTVLFAANAWRQTREGIPPSPMKFLVMASSFGFWWFAIVSVNDILLSVILFEIFHDLQYCALVWVFNEGRVAKNMAASAVERFLFRPGWRIALYAALILAYGYLGLATGYANAITPKLLGGGDVSRYLAFFIFASAFLHFYFDGFIWRVRESGFRKELSIRDAVAKPVKTYRVGWIPGGLKWALFVVPVAVLGTSEYKHSHALGLEQYRNIVQILPDEWHLNFVMGNLESNEDRAFSYLKNTARLKPDFAPAQKMLAEMYSQRGMADSAFKHYQIAVDLNPLDRESQDSLKSLSKKLSYGSL